VSEASATRLLEGPLQQRLRLVVSGHTHQSLQFNSHGVRHVWVPSTAFIISDALQQSVGKKVVGIGWLTLSARAYEYLQLVPPGSEDHELTQLGFYRQRAESAMQRQIARKD
jgi:hypothetical protein